MEFHRIPWSFMEFHGILWKPHGVPWNYMEFHGSSMEFHGVSWNSMEFHGTPGKASSLENTPWNSREIHVLILHGIPWKIFQRIPWNSMKFHGNPCPNTPWNSMENVPSNSMELHAIPWRYFTRVLCGQRPQEWSPILILRGMLVFFMVMASRIARGCMRRTTVAFHDILT